MTESGEDAGSGRLIVLYDATCRVCTRIAGRMAGLDGGRRLRLVSLQRSAAGPIAVRRLARERDLRSSLHVIDEDGDWASGGEAMVRAMERLPVMRTIARVARLPVVSSMVEPAYQLLADNRARLGWLSGSFGPAPPGRALGRALSGSGRSRCRDRAGSARSRR